MSGARSKAIALLVVSLIAVPGSAGLAQLRTVQPLSPIPQAEIFFAEGSAVLSDDAKLTLDAEAKALLVHPAYKVVVYGHADPFEAGSIQGVWDLGLQRALAAMYYLIATGVPAERLRPDSRGCEYLILTQDSPQARAEMRKVTTEVQLPEPHSKQFCFGLCGASD